MKKIFTLVLFAMMITWYSTLTMGQTPIPNGGFENWINHGNYDDPESWDTPNAETAIIPFFGVSVVTKSTDHSGGTYSARLETKHITLPPIDVPGFMTLGTLSVDLAGGTFVLTGGVPIDDSPTHLQGFYKYAPLGGDSCVIGIGFTKWNGTTRDSIAYAAFSTHSVVSDWTFFSAWVDYDTVVQPDTMNIIAMSTAQEVMTPGTVLYVDDLVLDYTAGVNDQDPKTGIEIYQDKETKRIMMFYDFSKPQYTTSKLYNMTGQVVGQNNTALIRQGRQEINYMNLPQGVYVLEILHHNLKFTKKFILNF